MKMSQEPYLYGYS